MKNYTLKCQKLTKIIENCTKNDVVIAFSGGVDSALLLKIVCDYAKESNVNVYAVTINSVLNAVKEIDFTQQIAKEFGAIHKIIELDPLKDAKIYDNPKNRCYLCKKYMFERICEFAKSVNADCIMDGTNFDDTQTYRPGLKALDESGIISPLVMAEFTKEDVRKLASEYGVSASNKPSTPCLATRFEYGTTLTQDKIKIVEEAEEYIKYLGFYNVRVRVHDSLARVEVDYNDVPKLVENRESIINKLKELGFKYITVDLEGFVSGSMDK